MKKTNLALAIFAAIAVAACGGSSSNDDAPVDKKPETPVTPTKPTTGGNETPETPKTPEEAKPETPAVAGGGAGGKTDGEKPKEKKPEPTPAGGGGKSVPTTVAEAEKVLNRSKEELNNLNNQSEEAARELLTIRQPLTDLEVEINVLQGQIDSASDADQKKNLQTKKKRLEKQLEEKEAIISKLLKSVQEKADQLALKITKKEIEVAQNEALHARLAEEPLAKVDSLDLKAKVLELTQAKKEAETDKQNAENEYDEKNKQSAAVNQKVADAEQKVKDLAVSGTPEEKEAADQEMKKAKDEQDKFRQELADLERKKDETKKHFDNLNKELNETKPKAKEAEEIAKNVGFSMNGTAIGDIKKIDRIKKEENGNYLITLKGDEKPFQMILKGDGAATEISGNYGYFGAGSYKTETEAGTTAAAPADGKKIHYALKTNNDSKEVAELNKGKDEKFQLTAQDSGYGYIGEDFYHFGQLTDLTQMEDLFKDPKLTEVKYTGSAFVKEILPAAAADAKDAKDENKTEPRMLVADVTATADFAGDKTTGLKTFSGAFSKFTPYLDEKGEVQQTLTADKDKTVDFVAVIDGNTFKPAEFLPPEKAEANAKVNGNFYGQKAANFGGLVEHKTFSGSFGGTKVSKE